MHALVTGANGLIGAHLVRALRADGHVVRAFVRPQSDRRSLGGIDVDLAFGDVLRPETLRAAAGGCDVLFHTATPFTYSEEAPGALRALAVDGTLNVLEAAQQSGVRRVVFTSSSVVLGSRTRPVLLDETHTMQEADPPPYVVAKVAQEHAAFAQADVLGLEVVGVCPTITVGPFDYRLGPSNGLIIAYLEDPFKLTYPGGCNIVAAADVARGHVLAAEAGTPGTRYVLGSENLEWLAIHRILSELCGVPGPTVYTNHTGAYIAAAAEELIAWVRRRPPNTTRVQAKMVGRYYWYRHDRSAALGFTPRPARQALAEAVAWLAASPHVSRRLRTTLKLSREVYRARRILEREPA